MNPEADIEGGGKTGKDKGHISAKNAMLKSIEGGRGLMSRPQVSRLLFCLNVRRAG